MIFAAGALYEILPLWVAKGSKCEGGVVFPSQSEMHACLSLCALADSGPSSRPPGGPELL